MDLNKVEPSDDTNNDLNLVRVRSSTLLPLMVPSFRIDHAVTTLHPKTTTTTTMDDLESGKTIETSTCHSQVEEEEEEEALECVSLHLTPHVGTRSTILLVKESGDKEPSLLNCIDNHPHDPPDPNSTTATNTTMDTSILTPEAEFLAVVRFCIYIGKAAFRYGSPGSKVEQFLQRLMEDRFGYYLGMFRATQSELLCSVCQQEDDPPRTFLVAIEPGLNLHKLGLLADLVDQVVPCGPQAVTRLEAIAQLKEIELAPNPWGKILVFFSFPFVGAGLSMVLGGSWWDVCVAAALAVICFATIEYLPRCHPRFAQWIPLLTSFAVSTIATIVQRAWLPGLHVTLVTLSAIAVLLPGYTVSMGIGELVSNRIISGAANLVGGMVCMFWLVIGAWLGDALGTSLTTASTLDDGETPTWDSVPTAWQALFIPMLCVSLIAAFQVSRRDMYWCFFHLHLTYITFLVTGLILERTHKNNGNDDGADDDAASTILNNGGRNLQTYLSTVVSCIFANAWAIRTNRPNSILMVPALVFLVSGSIGFQGLLNLLLLEEEDGDGDGEGNDKGVGTAQFLQMIIVALLIVAGLLTGNTLLEPSSTL